MSAINGLLERFVRRGRVTTIPAADGAGAAEGPDGAGAAEGPDGARGADSVDDGRPEMASTIELGVQRTGRPTTLRERGRLRARARYLRRLRDLQLRDIGGFMLEQHRRGRLRPDLVQRKVQSAAATDRELRALEGVLEDRMERDELRTAGIGGACPRCGNVHGSIDRYCSWCGQQL